LFSWTIINQEENHLWTMDKMNFNIITLET